MTASTERARLAWSARIKRAADLAPAHPPAAAILNFYRDLAAFQQSLLAEAARVVQDKTPELKPATLLNRPVLASLASSTVRWLRDQPHGRIAAMAAEFDARDTNEWQQRIDEYWVTANDAAIGSETEFFVIETVLQPFVELICSNRPNCQTPTAGDAGPDDGQRVTCHCCGTLPFAATLREHGHGARRSLVCALCQREWPALRLVCPACGENAVDRLPVFRADDVPWVRIDACDRCRVYVKTIDLTADGAAIPVVDDIATPALDLWAAEKGYRKLRKNLLRL